MKISTLLFKIANYFKENQKTLFVNAYTKTRDLVFTPPHRVELEYIEINLSIASNLDFIDTVKNPAAVFWYLISFIKNLDDSLVPFDLFSSEIGR